MAMRVALDRASGLARGRRSPKGWVLALGAVLALAAAIAARAAMASEEPAPAPAAAPDVKPETVVMLHGLARGPRSMTILAKRLEDAGYRVVPIGYPSTTQEPEALVAHVRAEIERCCGDAEPLHFVTYSLGSLLVRATLAQGPPEGLGRVVMLGPPNQGSELVDEFGDWALFRFLGPTAEQLGTGDGSFPRRLGAVDFEVGIIAGTRGNPVGNRIIPGESDGTVGIDSARLEGMTDFIAVEHSHTFLMRSERVAAETVHFLQDGRFSPDATRPPKAEPEIPGNTE